MEIRKIRGTFRSVKFLTSLNIEGKKVQESQFYGYGIFSDLFMK